ncbi:MAG: aminoacyl-tRNA hydrolase [Clostridia bacterium]|nr:aminoacyl-tRNA hydrolase [Clostridia bacterium]MBQ8290199.1 aminoacyl-tRNA hydrolase [Clostridia bacterium]
MTDIFDLFKKIESAPARAAGPVTHLIVGLGNIGAQYEKTRHNAGFMALDLLAERYGARVNNARFHALVGEATVGTHRVLFMKPTTFMNNSGLAVGEAAAFYKIPPENIIVLVDEISFDPGFMRIRRKGSAGGHNGLKSIIAAISSEQFPRIKLGIGQKPTPEYDLADFVLSRMPDEDIARLSSLSDAVADSVALMLDGKIDDAMSRYSR